MALNYRAFDSGFEIQSATVTSPFRDGDDARIHEVGADSVALANEGEGAATQRPVVYVVVAVAAVAAAGFGSAAASPPSGAVTPALGK